MENSEEEIKQEEVKENTELKGRIIKVNTEEGYGFIISSERKFVKFFFHWTGLQQTTKAFKDLKVGEKVLFTPLDSVRGPRAIQIKII